MEFANQLRSILDGQKKQCDYLESCISDIENVDYINENERLNKEVAHYKVLIEQHEETIQKLEQENLFMKQQFFARVYQQRNEGIRQSHQAESELLNREENAVVRRLAAHNSEMRQRLASLRVQLDAQGEPAKHLLSRVAELEQQTGLFMNQASMQIKTGFDDLNKNSAEVHEAIAQEPVSINQLQETLRRNSMELKFGTRIPVIIGIFLILMGVVFGLRYTYEYVEDPRATGALAYLLGICFMVVSEFMNRRQKTPFTIGICAGGISFLFATTAVSYFNLKILSIPVALIICVAIAALSLLQSYRYNNQLIAIFALIGGYLPMMALYNQSTVMIVSAMIYFTILNLFVLLIALSRKWQVLKYFSLGLCYISTALILNFRNFNSFSAGIIYVMANLLLYLVIILIYPIKRQQPLKISDTVLLGLNALCNAGLLFMLLGQYDYNALNGVITLVFCVIYFALARLISVAVREDSGTRVLFHITSLAFLVATIPLLLEPELISIGWLCEGTALWVCGILFGRKGYRRAGQAACLLCAFALVETTALFPDSAMDFWASGVSLISAFAILGATYYKHNNESDYWATINGSFMKAFQFATLAYSLLYTTLLCSYIMDSVPFASWQWRDFVSVLIIACIPHVLILIYRQLPIFKGTSFQVLSHIFYGLGFFLIIIANSIFIPTEKNLSWLIAILALIFVDVISVVVLHMWLGKISNPRNSQNEVQLLLTCLYSLVICIELFVVQVDISFSSMILSFILMAWALVLVILGFMHQYTFMRRCGLALSLISVSKLFIVDLYFLETIYRVISYFVFGAVFIAIAYIYQNFSRKLAPSALNDITPLSPSEIPAEHMGPTAINSAMVSPSGAPPTPIVPPYQTKGNVQPHHSASPPPPSSAAPTPPTAPPYHTGGNAQPYHSVSPESFAKPQNPENQDKSGKSSKFNIQRPPPPPPKP